MNPFLLALIPFILACLVVVRTRRANPDLHENQRRWRNDKKR